MKTINRLLIAMGLLLSVQVSSQVQFGIKGGASICYMHSPMFDDYASIYRSKLGFQLGVVADIPILPNTLSLQPAFLFSNKGYSYDVAGLVDPMGDDIVDIEGYYITHQNYLEIPILLAYKIGGLQLSAGPYIALGIGGRASVNYSYRSGDPDSQDEPIISDYSFKIKSVFGEVDFNDGAAYNAFDFGLNFGIGYQVNNVLIDLGGSFGLVNTIPGYVDSEYYDLTTMNRVISLSVSYFFADLF